MLIDAESTRELAGYTGGGMFLLFITRMIYKMLRSDLKEVRDSDKQEVVLGQFMALADRYKKEADQNAERADTFAQERNAAIEELGKLRGEVVSLTAQVEHLQKQIVQLTQTINTLNKMCTVQDDNSTLVAMQQPINADEGVNL